jgi:hypothetical protein
MKASTKPSEGSFKSYVSPSVFKIQPVKAVRMSGLFRKDQQDSTSFAFQTIGVFEKAILL